VKRFLVRTSNCDDSARQLPAPRLGYQSRLLRPNHKLVLRKDRHPYNYPEIINIFRPN